MQCLSVRWADDRAVCLLYIGYGQRLFVAGCLYAKSSWASTLSMQQVMVRVNVLWNVLASQGDPGDTVGGGVGGLREWLEARGRKAR